LDDFPYEDKDVLIAKWREEWIKSGCKWMAKLTRPPEGWNAQEQLKNLKM